MWKRLIRFGLLISTIFVLVSCVNDDSHTENDLDENTEKQNESEMDASKEILDKSNQFGIDLIEQLRAEDDKNLFISPISLYIALSMVYPSADNETKIELSTLLGTQDMTAEDWNEANITLLQVLNEEREKASKLLFANSFWLDDSYKLNENYKQVIEQNFKGKIANIDSNEELAVEDMNQWVSEQTDGNIDEVVESPLDDNFVAMLINAIYFNGKWTYPFDPDHTEDNTFYLVDDEEIEVPFMNIQQELDYVNESDYEAVRLPYGEKQNIAMYLFKPTEMNDLTTIHKALEQDGMNDITANMQREAGAVSLPTFELDYEKKMNEVLKQLGMEQAFDEEEADFPKMIDSDERVHISEVNHMTYLNINEEGTEAAASTNIGIDTMSIPEEESFELIFDSPFVMLIVEEETGAIIFIGDIQDVSA